TALMMFNFGWFREQTCTIACPYGRLQSVLLDRQSLIISYDVNRGEPRTHAKRPATALPIIQDSALSRDPARPELVEGKGSATEGDCVDCSMCVQVCPTGIDIRNGLQV